MLAGFTLNPAVWSNILKTYCNSELIWCDLILLKKSPKSGHVKLKIAKVTTNGTRRTKLDYTPKWTFLAYFRGYMRRLGLKYIYLPLFSPLGNRKITLKIFLQLREYMYTYIHERPDELVVLWGVILETKKQPNTVLLKYSYSPPENNTRKDHQFIRAFTYSTYMYVCMYYRTYMYLIRRWYNNKANSISTSRYYSISYFIRSYM